MNGLEPYQGCLSGILVEDFHGAGSNAGPFFGGTHEYTRPSR